MQFSGSPDSATALEQSPSKHLESSDFSNGLPPILGTIEAKF
jgi:hypothetical protein